MRTKLSLSDRVAARTWYHKIDLGSGISTPGAPFGVVFDARIFSSRDPTVVGSVSPASTPSSKAPSWTVSIPIKMLFAHLKRNLASGGERAFPGPRYRLVFSGTIGFAAFAARTPTIPSKLSMTRASTYLRLWLTAPQPSCLCEQPSEEIEWSPDHPQGYPQIPPNRRGNGTIIFHFSQDALGGVVKHDR